jgi:hypothetical protein
MNEKHQEDSGDSADDGSIDSSRKDTKIKKWKSGVISGVSKTSLFTIIASGLYYKFVKPLPTDTAGRMPHYHTKMFRTLNFAANITTLSVFYFAIQQFMRVNELRLLPLEKMESKARLSTGQEPNNQEKEQIVMIENRNEPIVQHALSGFITGAWMQLLINPSRITKAWKPGLILALISTVSYKSYEQFVLWKYNKLIQWQELEWKKQQGLLTDEDTKKSFMDRLYDRIPEWIRNEDEDTANIRMQYQALRRERERIQQESQYTKSGKE